VADVPKPVPVVDAESAPFWEACREHRLLVQRCGACGAAVFFPRAICPECHADALGWEQASGRGTVYSFTVSHRPASPAWADDVPYAVAIVELDEGCRMLGDIVTDDVDAVHIGMAVEVVFDAVADDVVVPRWRPA
jgi:uncharacterized OB-fold protein